ncbi:hypothetical protein CVE86_22940 [Salmonella enterica]|nr:hypothetical protein [Salmonella enterica]EDO3720927.1 hypothetical protein [Salmonella enterica]EEA1748193.1 hypothetical protein [Salmonella enterica]
MTHPPCTAILDVKHPPTSQPANQPTSQPANQPTSQPANQPDKI